MDKTLSKSEAFFGADNVKAPEPNLVINLFLVIGINLKNL